MKDENILGVLDVDSIKKNAFTKEDEEFLKEVSTIIGNTFPKIKKE
jgi:putative methionine-R-sulfoxide reductase with GAF domain